MLPRSLCEITGHAVAAAEVSDLEEVGRALAVREAAIARASPAERAAALADGALLGLRLAELKRSLAREHGRLTQVGGGFASYCESSCLSPWIDLRG